MFTGALNQVMFRSLTISALTTYWKTNIDVVPGASVHSKEKKVTEDFIGQVKISKCYPLCGLIG